ncbi:MAG: superoxide dismutase [Runella slithyformis]|nr:MAG: superoxide dismutase [Runella slithyformis]
MAFELPKLTYAYNALEPHIDARTMEIHHSLHHAAYVNNLNNALKDTVHASAELEDIVRNISKHPMPVRNNGGGHYNHAMFWEILALNGGSEPVGSLGEAINKQFGSFASFKETFANAAMTRFGSGWAWLVLKEDKTLAVSSTPNQDCPLMDVAEVKGQPIIGLDVWEHAYYLKYQNRRAEYVSAWWSVINWNEVEKRYKSAL